MEYYALTHWVISCLRGFRSRGWDTGTLTRAAGLTQAELDSTYCDATKASRLFDLAWQHYGEEAGIASRLGLVPNTFGSLSLAVLAAGNWGTGLAYMARYSRYISNAVTYHYETDGSSDACFRIRVAPGFTLSPTAGDAILAATLRTFRFIHPRLAGIRQVHLARPRPANPEPVESYFKAPLMWNQPDFAIWFDQSALQAPSMHADRDLEIMHLNQTSQALAQLETSRFVTELKAVIRDALAEESVSIQVIAARLNMSARSLQRRLTEEGTSFSALLETVRQQSAADALRQRNTRISELALRLGFSDSSNFSRAFRRWFGCSPQDFRKRSLSSH